MHSKYIFIFYIASFIFAGTALAQTMKCITCTNSICTVDYACMSNNGSQTPPLEPVVVGKPSLPIGNGTTLPPREPVITNKEFKAPTVNGTAGGSGNAPTTQTGKPDPLEKRVIDCSRIPENTCKNNFYKQYCKWTPPKAGECVSKMSTFSKWIFEAWIQLELSKRKNVSLDSITDIHYKMPSILCKPQENNSIACHKLKRNITIPVVDFKIGDDLFIATSVVAPFACTWNNGASGECGPK